MSVSIARVGIGGFVPCPYILFFFSALLTCFSMTLMRTDLAAAGWGIFLLGVGGVWVQLLGDQGVRARVILVVRECIWNAACVPAWTPNL